MPPRIGVVVFPGTNCEHDVVQAVELADRLLANPVIEQSRLELEAI